jgi:hypothetical protein
MDFQLSFIFYEVGCLFSLMFRILESMILELLGYCYGISASELEEDPRTTNSVFSLFPFMHLILFQIAISTCVYTSWHVAKSLVTKYLISH